MLCSLQSLGCTQPLPHLPNSNAIFFWSSLPIPSSSFVVSSLSPFLPDHTQLIKAVNLGHSLTQSACLSAGTWLATLCSVERLQDSMLSKYGPWLLSWQLLLIPRHALSPSHTRFCGRPPEHPLSRRIPLSWGLFSGLELGREVSVW